MWHDWHVEVRNAAAQCLGKTSHGRDVHNDIRERILDGSERTKLEAINKLGRLGNKCFNFCFWKINGGQGLLALRFLKDYFY